MYTSVEDDLYNSKEFKNDLNKAREKAHEDALRDTKKYFPEITSNIENTRAFNTFLEGYLDEYEESVMKRARQSSKYKQIERQKERARTEYNQICKEIAYEIIGSYGSKQISYDQTAEEEVMDAIRSISFEHIK